MEGAWAKLAAGPRTGVRRASACSAACRRRRVSRSSSTRACALWSSSSIRKAKPRLVGVASLRENSSPRPSQVLSPMRQMSPPAVFLRTLRDKAGLRGTVYELRPVVAVVFTLRSLPGRLAFMSWRWCAASNSKKVIGIYSDIVTRAHVAACLMDAEFWETVGRRLSLTGMPSGAG